MNVLQHLWVDRFAFGFDVGDLAANHSIDGACSSGKLCKDGGAAICGGGSCTDGFKCQSQKSIAREDGDGFAEFLMASRFATAEVIVVQRRQIIVDQGESMDEFDGAGGVKGRLEIAGENTRRLETEDRADALATGKDAVTHRCMNGRG